MTIFQVLRYMPSYPPTLDQLKALPIEIYNMWVNHPKVGWSVCSLDTRNDKVWIAEWYKANANHQAAGINNDMKILKIILQEWK